MKKGKGRFWVDFNRKKHGQITLFIIIGVVILLSTALIFYIRSNTIANKLDEEPVLKKVPIEMQPVELYVTDCIDSVAVEALIKIGQHGGYISFTDKDILGETITFIESPDPTMSDLVEAYPGTGMKVPYWWYMSSENTCETCTFLTKRPPLYKTKVTIDPTDYSIERQIDRYIEKKLPECLQDFKTLKEEGYEIEPTGPIIVDTTIAKNDIRILVTYPIKIKIQGRETTIDQFYDKIDFNLKKIYDLATDITNAEINYTIIEQQSLDLIASLGGIDKPIPPMRHIEIGFGEGPTYWSKHEVKTELERMFMSYTPMIQVEQSANYKPNVFDDPMQNILYDQFIIRQKDADNNIILTDDYSQLSTKFVYLNWWPIYFDMPSNGELIGPTSDLSQALVLMQFRMADYELAYDISYPVIALVVDPTAEPKLHTDSRGYVFHFALEANIRANEALSTKEKLPGAIRQNTNIFADQKNRNSGNISFKVLDAVTNKPISQASAHYRCGDQTAFIGPTNNSGEIKTQFPQCLGGLIVLSKDNYFQLSKELSAIKGKPERIGELRMQPYRKINVSLKEYKVQKIIVNPPPENGYQPPAQYEWIVGSNPLQLDENEYASINIERVKEHPYEAPLVQMLIIAWNQTGTQQIQLIPGRYKVSITQYTENVNIFIPEEKKAAIDLGFLGKIGEYTIPEIKIDGTVTSGGVVLNEKTEYWIVSSDDLQKKLVTFKTYSPNLAGASHKNIKDLGYLGKTEEYSIKYKNQIIPEIS